MTVIVRQRKGESLRNFNARATQSAGIKTGNPMFDRNSTPVKGSGDWNPNHKNIGSVSHPPPSDEVPHRTSNPVFKPIPKGAKIARAVMP